RPPQRAGPPGAAAVPADPAALRLRGGAVVGRRGDTGWPPAGAAAAGGPGAVRPRLLQLRPVLAGAAPPGLPRGAAAGGAVPAAAAAAGAGRRAGALAAQG